MPPECWHEENVSRLQGAVNTTGLRELWKPFQVGILNVYRGHDHGRALQECFSLEFSRLWRKAENSFRDVCFVDVLVVVRIKQSHLLLT